MIVDFVRMLFEAEEQKPSGSVPIPDQQMALYMLSLIDAGAKIDDANRDVLDRAALMKSIPPALMKLYERIRAKRPTAVAVVHGSTCSNCRRIVRPAQLVDLRMFRTIGQCEGCKCILVMGAVADAALERINVTDERIDPIKAADDAGLTRRPSKNKVPDDQ